MTFIFSLLLAVAAQAQVQFAEPTTVFVIHSSGNHLKMAGDYGGQLEAATASSPQRMTIVPDGKGYYYIQEKSGRYLSKLNTWNTTFVTANTSDDTRFTFEKATGAYLRIRCKGNGLCLGTDNNDAGAKVYSNKDGADMKHLWFFSDKVNGIVPTDTLCYAVFPSVVRQKFLGWACRSAGGLTCAASGRTRRLTRL